MKGNLRTFIKFNRSNKFIKWMVAISYVLIILAFVDIILLLITSPKNFSGPLVVLAVILLGAYVYVIFKLRSQLNASTNFGGVDLKADDYTAPKTMPYKFSIEASEAIERLANENEMSPEDYLLTLVRHQALSSAGYTTLTEYLNNARTDNDRIAASEKILEDKNKGLKE